MYGLLFAKNRHLVTQCWYGCEWLRMADGLYLVSENFSNWTMLLVNCEDAAASFTGSCGYLSTLVRAK